MCSVVGALVASAVVGGYSAYSQRQAASEAADASRRQAEQAKQAAAAPMAASESGTDVTAAVQANRRRVAAANGMADTITGAGASYNNGSGVGVGTKKTLGS